MKRLWFLPLSLVGLAVLLATAPRTIRPSMVSSAPLTAAAPAVSTPAPLRYSTHTLPQAIVHTLVIPADDRYLVTAAVSPSVNSVKTFAQQQRAIAAMNAGFFDPQNQKSTSYITLAGKQVADPQKNERLINNPNLAPYLSKILNRSEFRRYQCGQVVRYEITLHNQPAPTGCEVVDAIGGGPRLLPEDTSAQEGFVDNANGRDALASRQPNARTAIGITRQGEIVWVMVAQRPDAPSNSGLSLPELAEFMKTLGVEAALNLDGGSSSSFYYKDKAVYGKVDAAGNRVDRPVKSVLLLQDAVNSFDR